VAASAALSLRLGTATNTKGRINNHEHIARHGVPLSGYQRILLLIRNPGVPPLSPLRAFGRGGAERDVLRWFLIRLSTWACVPNRFPRSGGDCFSELVHFP